MKVYVINNLSSSLEHLLLLIRQMISEPTLINFNELRRKDISVNDIVILSGSHDHTAVWNGDIFKKMRLISSSIIKAP